MKRRQIAVVVFALLSTETLYAKTPHWTKVASSDSGQTVYIDTNNLSSKGRVIRVWSLLDLVRPDKANKNALSIKSMMDVDCNASTSSLLFLINYSTHMANDSGIIDQQQYTPKSVPIIPGSIGESIKNYACKRSEDEETLNCGFPKDYATNDHFVYALKENRCSYIYASNKADFLQTISDFQARALVDMKARIESLASASPEYLSEKISPNQDFRLFYKELNIKTNGDLLRLGPQYLKNLKESADLRKKQAAEWHQKANKLRSALADRQNSYSE